MFAAMKLSSQVSQYWTNLENKRVARRQPLIDRWDRMKNELQIKYIPPSFSVRLMDKWHQYTQGTKSVKEYVTKFNEFLIRCSTLNTKG